MVACLVFVFLALIEYGIVLKLTSSKSDKDKTKIKIGQKTIMSATMAFGSSTSTNSNGMYANYIMGSLVLHGNAKNKGATLFRNLELYMYLIKSLSIKFVIFLSMKTHSLFFLIHAISM